MAFVQGQSARYSKESNTRAHYLGSPADVFSDKASKFAVKCNEATQGAVVRRISEIYSDIFIDEFQDLAGWDLELVEAWLQSPLCIQLVGDPRQFVYATNHAGKNRKFRGANIVNKIHQWEQRGLLSIEQRVESYRCSDSICEFANHLWPSFPPMISKATYPNIEHVGVYFVPRNEVDRYLRKYLPQVIRPTVRQESFGQAACNYGAVKGRQFDRTLIVPTGKANKFIQSGDVNVILSGRERLYVAITRARYSVAIVTDAPSAIGGEVWKLGVAK